MTGGTGTNTLDVVASGTGSQTVSGFTLTGVQNVTVQNADTTATNTLTLGMGSATGVTGFTNTLSSANVAFTDVGAIAGLNITSAQADTTVGYKSTVVSGTANSQNITLNGANTTVSGTVTVNGIETFNVTTAGAASGSSTKTTTLVSDVLQTVNVAGDQTASLVVDLSGYASATKTGTFDAGDATAAITATLTIDANDKLAVTGGSGNDVFTINNLGNSVTVTGGEGTDTVKTSATNLNQTQIANVAVENLNFTAGSTTLNLTGNNNITGVAYEAGFGASTAAGIASGTTFTTHAAGTSLGVTLRSTTPTDDTLNIVIGKTGASGSDGIAAGTITATGVEVMNFTSQAKTTPTTGATNSVTVAGTSLDTVTVAGSTKFALTQAGGSVKSYDASDATGVQDTSGITFKSSGATISGGSANDILTGGAGADSIEGNDGNDSVTGAAGNDQLFGGAGNDTLIAGTGKDTLTGGDGVDVFQFADGDSVSSTINTVTDFVSGTDRLSIGQTNNKFIGNFSDIDTALAAMTADDQSFFVTSSSQVYVVNKQGTLSSTDEVVKLTGVTQLTSADLGLGPLGPGNDITLTATAAVVNLTTNTNATAKSTNLDDTFYSLSDYITSAATLDGALGNDTLVLSSGAGGTISVTNVSNVEVLDLTAATSAVTAGTLSTGFTTARLSAKGDSIIASTTATSITGGAGNDNITGGTGNDTIYGGAGNDTIDGGATGSDTIYGEAGEDTLVIGSVVAGVSIDGGAANDTISSGSSDDALLGSYFGGEGTDTFTFDTGDDISGATIGGWEVGAVVGTVTMTLAQHNNFTSITGASTPKIVLAGAGGTLALDADVPAYDAGGVTSAMTVTGAQGATGQILEIDAAYNNSVTLTGTTTGNIKIVTGTGNDTISVDSASTINDSDTITGGDGTDTLTLAGNTAVTLGSSNAVTGIERFVTSQTTASVSLTLSSTYATATGVILTVDGTSLTTGSLTANVSSLATVGASVTGGSSGDSITGSAQNDTLAGGAGDDSILGGAGLDTISAGSGVNTILGGLGVDTINLDAAANQLDIIVLGTGELISNGTKDFGATMSEGTDIVNDFDWASAATGDYVSLSKGDLNADSGKALTLIDAVTGTTFAAAVARGDLVFGDVANGESVTSTTQQAFRLTTGASTAAAALGSGVITLKTGDFAGTEGALVVWYDTDTNEVVFTAVNGSADVVGNNDGIVAADFANTTAADLYRIDGISYSDFIAISAANLANSASIF